MRKPSRLILKMLDDFVIKCLTCSRGFNYKDILTHETVCLQSGCANELCNAKFVDAQARIKFVVAGVEYNACSKKCKKVAKFGLMLGHSS
jgi:hypothetical protein